MDYSEKWGVDIEEAVKLALIDLKVSEEEVDIEVLEQPSKGFFGIGSKLAKVRVTKKVKVEEKKVEEEKISVPVEKVKKERQDKPQPKEHKEHKNKKNKKNNRKAEGKDKKKEDSLNIEVVNKDELSDVEHHAALDFLKEITEKMGLTLNFSAKVGEDVVYIEMEGKDSGTVIGKRGQTLDAIQYLTSLVINKNSEKYIKVVVDAENYRAKRQKTLEQLATRLAAKVVKTRKYVRLEPMNPYERKVIHATLQQNPNITTRSEGEEPYRRVVIELKK